MTTQRQPDLAGRRRGSDVIVPHLGGGGFPLLGRLFRATAWQACDSYVGMAVEVQQAAQWTSPGRRCAGLGGCCWCRPNEWRCRRGSRVRSRADEKWAEGGSGLMLRLGEVGRVPGCVCELQVPFFASMVDDGDGRDAATSLVGSTPVASDLVS